MNDTDKNKIIFADNLNRFLRASNIDRNKLCADLNISYSTLADWLNAKKYPRIDKIELLANYFHVQKSDLIENKTIDVFPHFGSRDYIARIKNESYPDEVDPEIAEYLDQLKNTPGMRTLFSAAKGVSKEDLEAAADIISRMKEEGLVFVWIERFDYCCWQCCRCPDYKCYL